MKKIVLLLLCMLILTGCRTKEEQQIYKQVENDTSVLLTGDMDRINELFFGKTIVQTEKEESGFLGELFAMDHITVLTVTEGSVVLEVTAPDMHLFFTDRAEEIAEMTDPKQLRDCLLEYAEQTKPVTRQVELHCNVLDAATHIRYMDAAFLNALTGGLVDAYAQQYTQALGELGVQ